MQYVCYQIPMIGVPFPQSSLACASNNHVPPRRPTLDNIVVLITTWLTLYSQLAIRVGSCQVNHGFDHSLRKLSIKTSYENIHFDLLLMLLHCNSKT
jgi:hypothetical protein